MRMKFFYFMLLVMGNSVNAQLIITEVYANTPANEKLRFGNTATGFVNANKHHWGEFVEIFNYSDRDVNLNKWVLKDRQGVFVLPDKILEKRKFVVIAYSSLAYNTTPFPELFPTTIGKESQIIYQNEFLLRNKTDEVTLSHKLGNVAIEKSVVRWEFGSEPVFNFIKNAWSVAGAFYTVKSIQYHPDPQSTMDPTIQPDPYDLYNYTSTPNPLAADYVPAMASYEQLVKDEFQQYYSFLDWADNVYVLVENKCPIKFELVYQTPSGNYSGEGSKCFSYDIAGNMTIGSNCSAGETTPPTGIVGFSTDELEAIKNSIVIYPNPTKAIDNYNVTITWSGAALGKITSVKIFHTLGSLVHTYTPGTNTTGFSLANHLPGTFIANFSLNSGQIISKNILKW